MDPKKDNSRDSDAYSSSPPLTPSTAFSESAGGCAPVAIVEKTASSESPLSGADLQQLSEFQRSTAGQRPSERSDNVQKAQQQPPHETHECIEEKPSGSSEFAESKQRLLEAAAAEQTEAWEDIVQITLDSFSLRQWPSIDSRPLFADGAVRAEIEVRHLFAGDTTCDSDCVSGGKVVGSNDRRAVCPHEAETGVCADGYLCPNAYRCPHDDGYTPLPACCSCQDQYLCPHEPNCPYRKYGQCSYRFNGPADKAPTRRKSPLLYARKNTLQVQKEQLETFAERTFWNILKHIFLLGPPAYANDDPRRQRKLTYLAELRYPPKRTPRQAAFFQTKEPVQPTSVSAQ